MTDDLGYHLDAARRSLASTTRPDGSTELTQAGVLELLELLEAAGAAATELMRIRRRLLAVVNDPTVRSIMVPVSYVAAVLRDAD